MKLFIKIFFTNIILVNFFLFVYLFPNDIFLKKPSIKTESTRLSNYTFFEFDDSMYNCNQLKEYYERILNGNEQEAQHIEYFKSKYNDFINNIDNFWSVQPRIPKIFHQIWLGPHPFPEKYKKFRKNWLQKNPEWIYVLWTDAEARKLNLINRKFYDKTPSYAEKANILRYEVLYRFGGVYLDTDCDCFKSIDILNHCCDFYAGLEYPLASFNAFMIGNALIAAKPKHFILEALIGGIENSWDMFQPWSRINQLERSGTRYFTRTVKEVITSCQGNNIIFPANIFYPWRYKKGKIPVESLGIHYWDGLWLKKPKKPKQKKNIKATSKKGLTKVIG